MLSMILRLVNPLVRCQRALILDTRQTLIFSYKSIRYRSDRSAVTTSKRSEVDTNVKPIGEKVKETTKTASYLSIILLGVGVTGALFYAVFSELFSSNSPNSIYTQASKICLNDTRVQDALGEPITIYGEETRRRRRQHVGHFMYEKNGKKYLRMHFYLKGSFRKGTAQLEMIQVD